MVAMNFVSRVPNSPRLNENFYIVWAFAGSTFTAAYTSIASFVSEVRLTGASYVSFYPAGTVSTGAWTVKGYVVKGTDGTYNHSSSITIANSEIADPAKTLYDILRTNVGTTYATTNFNTGWYSATSAKPQVTITRGGYTTRSQNQRDTHRWHDVTLHVDTWTPDKSPGGPSFGAGGYKEAHTLLDMEVKRIIDANRLAPSSKLVHLMIINSIPLDEVADNRRIFRTRHTCRAIWTETIG